jgi:SET domain-containing protein
MFMIIKKSSVNIEVRDYARKGRGVCLNDKVEQGTIIESLPVLVLNPETYLAVKQLPFINHTFVWDQSGQGESGALGFGFASLCNHSASPNAIIRRNYAAQSIDLVALRSIRQDEEVTIKYNNTPFQFA